MQSAVNNGLAAMRDGYEAVKAIPKEKRTFANTIAALHYASESISNTLQILDLISNVHPDETIRAAAQAAHTIGEAGSIDIEHDRDIWRATNELVVTKGALDEADQKLYDDTMRDLRRMGFGLTESAFQKLKEMRKELTELEQVFGTAINNYEDFIALPRDRLDGLPERYIDSLPRTPEGLYRISLQYPDLFPFMDMADDDAARRELAIKNLRKGGPKNLERLAAMVALRGRIAALLGYATHADYVDEVRMVKTGAHAIAFIEDLLTRLAPVGQVEMRELIAYKQHVLGLEHPKPILFHEALNGYEGYWSHRLKTERYALDTEKLSEYFPLERVRAGVEKIYQDLLGVRFVKANIPVWHPDVEAYEVRDQSTGELIGHYFLDLYPRPGKYGHAAAFPLTLAHTGGTSTVALVCNFPKPTATTPSLLSVSTGPDSVETYLHEFGHVMHGLLSTNRYQAQNGFGVALDFVEALSQMFEYWFWDSRSLALLSGHYRTGKPLPDELTKKIMASRHHQVASYYLRVATAALFDLRIHSFSPDAPPSADDIAQLHRDMRLEYEHIDLPDDAIYPAGWGHMAGYDAGYYGYLWSKVYAADMFTRFAPDPLSSTVGHEYRAKVLAPGASRPELDLVRDFLGREPSNAAFLDELGVS